MKRNTSVPRVLGDEDVGQSSFARRRAPSQHPLSSSGRLSEREYGGNIGLPLQLRSPIGSPTWNRRARSPSPLRRSGAPGKSTPGWGRAATFGAKMPWRPRAPANEDSYDQGPKTCFRLVRTLRSRKSVALLAAVVCLLAGARRVLGTSEGHERGGSSVTLQPNSKSPGLRGGLRWSSRGEVLLSGETRYCSAPLAYPPPEQPRTESGGSADLELRLLQVTIRHGDRSAIHDIPGADERRWRCLPFSEEVTKAWEGVSRFGFENVDGKPLERSLLPSVDGPQEGSKGGFCQAGQLTEVGVRQHLTLGERMRKAYGALLGDLNEDEIYIRSTDYTRTLESAAAFLMSFFPGSPEMTIVINEDENAEVMHGIGLKHSSQGVTGGHETTIIGTCQRAVDLSQAQSEAFKPRTDVIEELVSLFGDEISTWKMTETGDALHARSCHNMTLPCSHKGCVSPSLALGAMAEADRQMCLRYVGAAGGGAATALSLYPFMQELLNNMKRALTGESPVRFSLFSGHDTVIAPLLAAIGAYDCKWPPYASHVAFELWTKAGRGGGRRARRRLEAEDSSGAESDTADRDTDGTSGGVDPGGSERSAAGLGDAPPDRVTDYGKAARHGAGDAGAGDARAEGAAAGDESLQDAFVRVTFNGRSVTHLVPDCAHVTGPYGRDLCPLAMLAKTIDRALAPHDSLKEACEAA